MTRRVNVSSDTEAGYYEAGLSDDWARAASGPVDTPVTSPTPAIPFNWNNLTAGLLDVYRQKELAKINAKRDAAGLGPLMTLPPGLTGGSPMQNPLVLLGIGTALFFGARHFLNRR